MLQANTMTDDHGHFLMDHVPLGNVSIGRSICIGERPRACTTTHNVRLVTKPGETSRVTIGGTGRPIIGRLIAPVPIELQSGAPYSDFKLHTKLPPSPEPPRDWKTMTDEQKRVWLDAPSAEREAFRQAIQTMVSYPFGVRPDGSFRIEDVPPGDYQLDVTISELRTNATAVLNEPIARLKHEFTVPVIPGGRSDEPLDLGELELKPVEPQQ